MSKKFIQIIAMMLITSMLAGTGMIAYAQESASQQTQTAENDELYQEAIGFLNYLGIFYGDENGDMKPEDTITRAEISAIILREMNVTSKATYNGIFTDVDSSHWAADDIQTAYENGIISGYGDGTFGPDDDVTYEQAVKMVVCAINWGPFAAAYGEYPIGYLHIADEQDIMDNASGKVGE
ncbi:MAG: S-layer homology domain-containing protein, partial [Clostridia bacterium]|nr:S-layer homology domain-containing protein [Clostridia bacterium]